MFQFAGLASTCLWIQHGIIQEPQDHSSFVSSPRLIADFHALHRLPIPRHPPCALKSLTTYTQSSRYELSCRSNSVTSTHIQATIFFRLRSNLDLPENHTHDAQRHRCGPREDAIYLHNQIVKERYPIWVPITIVIRSMRSAGESMLATTFRFVSANQ